MDTGERKACGKAPVLHVGYYVEDGLLTDGFLCSAHLWTLDDTEFLQAHPPSHDCGMPGSLWFFEENVCRCPESTESMEVMESIEAPVLA